MGRIVVYLNHQAVGTAGHTGLCQRRNVGATPVAWLGSTMMGRWDFSGSPARRSDPECFWWPSHRCGCPARTILHWDLPSAMIYSAAFSHSSMVWQPGLFSEAPAFWNGLLPAAAGNSAYCGRRSGSCPHIWPRPSMALLADYLADGGKTRLLFRLCHIAEPFFLQTLEGVGGGAGFVGAAADNLGRLLFSPPGRWTSAVLLSPRHRGRPLLVRVSGPISWLLHFTLVGWG